MTTTSALTRLRLLAGLALAGEGLLVVTRILDHEAPLAWGWASLVLGIALLAAGGFRASPDGERVPRARRIVVAALGLLAAGGIVAWNALARSDVSTPEIAILAYGVLLLLAAPALHRRIAGARVETLVAYSFPLALGPLGVFAVEGMLERATGIVGRAIEVLLVAPMALGLRLAGLPAEVMGQTIRLGSPDGVMFLSVGMVCSGLYATALFLGVFALFAWEARTPPRRLVAYLALGLLGLYLANVARLILLGVVGYHWGADALQSFHKHAGWILFIAWGIAYWWLVLRRFEAPRVSL